MSDKRSIKCLFGFHQYNVIDKFKKRTFTSCSGNLPEQITYYIISECEFCGSIKDKRVDL